MSVERRAGHDGGKGGGQAVPCRMWYVRHDGYMGTEREALTDGFSEFCSRPCALAPGRRACFVLCFYSVASAGCGEMSHEWNCGDGEGRRTERTRERERGSGERGKRELEACAGSGRRSGDDQGASPRAGRLG